MSSEDRSLHNGAVEYISRMEEYIVSAGRDGYIKYWLMSEIDNAEPDDSMNYYPKLQCQVFLGGQITHVQVKFGNWLVYDKFGKLFLLCDLHRQVQTHILQADSQDQHLLNKDRD